MTRNNSLTALYFLFLNADITMVDYLSVDITYDSMSSYTGSLPLYLYAHTPTLFLLLYTAQYCIVPCPLWALSNQQIVSFAPKFPPCYFDLLTTKLLKRLPFSVISLFFPQFISFLSPTRVTINTISCTKPLICHLQLLSGVFRGWVLILLYLPIISCTVISCIFLNITCIIAAFYLHSL